MELNNFELDPVRLKNALEVALDESQKKLAELESAMKSTLQDIDNIRLSILKLSV